MTDDPSPVTHTPAEPPLGIQQPLLPPVPLGQSMLQLKFFTPLGAQSLRVLDPSIFLPASNLAFTSEESPFQDSPFFDAPDSFTPSRSTVPTVQTQPQPRPRKPAPSEINLPTTAPFEGIAETSPIEKSPIETSPVEDLAIAEPLIARSPLPEIDAAISSPATKAIPSAPSEVAAIAQTPQSEPLNQLESPSPSISRLSTETPIDTPAEHSIEPLPSNSSALNDPPTETANEYPEAPLLQRSPASSDNVIAPISPQPTYPAAIQQTTNLEDSASPIAPISAENTITAALTDLTSSDADLPKSIQPEPTSTDTILSVAPGLNPTIPTSTDSTIAQPMLDAPEAISRLTSDESIEAVVDVAESVVQTASEQVSLENQEDEAPLSSDSISQARGGKVVSLLPIESDFRHSDFRHEDGSNTVSQEALAAPESPEFLLLTSPDSSVELSSTITRLSEPEASVDINSTSEPSGETIQRSPLEPILSETAMSAREDEPVAAIADHPLESPVSDVEIIQPKTTDPIHQGLRIAEISREQLSSEPNRSVEELQDLQSLATENLSQSIPSDTPTQSIQPEINTQVETSVQLATEPTIQPLPEAPSIAVETPVTAIQTEALTQADTDLAPASLSTEWIDSSWIDSSPAESEAQSTPSPGSDRDPCDVVVRPEATQTPAIQPISELSQPVQRQVAEVETIRSEAGATVEDESFIEADRTRPSSQNLPDLDSKNLAQPVTLDALAQRVQPETNTQIDPVTQPNADLIIQPAEAPLIVSDRSEAIQTPTIQPISEISQPIQRKVAAENVTSEAGATAENEGFIEADRSSVLPELPSVLQRLSILESIATMQSIYPAPVPPSQPTPATRSSVIPEIQTQPFESLFEVPFETPSVRRKSDVGTNDYFMQGAIASRPESFTLDTLTSNSRTQDSPVRAEWASIAELLQPPADDYSKLEPENTFPDDNYSDLLSSTHSTSSEMIQTSPAPPVEAAAPVETETNSDRQTPAQPNHSGSPEHLERLAQEVYQLIRQRLALERERSGKSGSGRLL